MGHDKLNIWIAILAQSKISAMNESLEKYKDSLNSAESNQLHPLKLQYNDRLVERHNRIHAILKQMTESVVIGRSTDAALGSMVKLYGKIRDQESGEALLGATIYFPESETGIITDQYGQYQVVLPAGIHEISVHNLGMKVVAEGSESNIVYDHLRELSCEYVQGFSVMEPKSADDIMPFITANIDPEN